MMDLVSRAGFPAAARGLILTALLGLVTFGFGVSPAIAQTADERSGADAAVRAARDAWMARDAAGLTALLPLTAGHALEPWVAYWELKLRLETAEPDEVGSFLQRWAGSYQEDRLRNDWLLLMGKRREWTEFQRHLDAFRMQDDPQVRCYATAAEAERSAQVPAAAPAQVQTDWFAQTGVDDGCLYAAEVLYRSRLLRADDIWMKARLSMERGRPDAARAAAGIISSESAREIAALNQNPRSWLSGETMLKTRSDQELVALALIRLARQDADAAAAQLRGRWQADLPIAMVDWLWGMIGKWSGLERSSRALSYYAQVRDQGNLSDDLQSWRARAALRAGQWSQVLDAVNAMQHPEADDGAWLYWRARAQLALQRSDAERYAALAELQRLAASAGERGFYQKLAAEALGQRSTVALQPLPLTADERQWARQHPGLRRALAAFQLDWHAEGVREWNYWIALHTPGGMSDRQLYAAADLACVRHIWDRCINTSEKTQNFMDFSQRFPTPHEDVVVPQSRASGVDPAYVYGLIRQESRFVPAARSSAGASGLMQIMPATARWTARKAGLDDYSPAQINELSVNTLLGTHYLQLMLAEFQGSLPLAAAAYNAGPGRPRSWREGPVLEGAVWIENIPFNETRDYVKKVLSNTVDYAALMTGQPQSLLERLGTVAPLVE